MKMSNPHYPPYVPPRGGVGGGGGGGAGGIASIAESYNNQRFDNSQRYPPSYDHQNVIGGKSVAE